MTRTPEDASELRRFAVALGGVLFSIALSFVILFFPSRAPAPAPLPGPRAVTVPPPIVVSTALPDWPDDTSVREWRVPSRKAAAPESRESDRDTNPGRPASDPVGAAALPDVATVSTTPSRHHLADGFTPAALPVPADSLRAAFRETPDAATTGATQPPRAPGRSHGALAGAFVTAGEHVGGGFRTVGRVLKRVF